MYNTYWDRTQLYGGTLHSYEATVKFCGYYSTTHDRKVFSIKNFIISCTQENMTATLNANIIKHGVVSCEHRPLTFLRSGQPQTCFTHVHYTILALQCSAKNLK